MSLRPSIAAVAMASAAAVSAPALAQDAPRSSEIVEKLNDPVTQYAVAGMLSALSKALLEVQVAPVVKAMEGVTGRTSDLPEDATVADLAGAYPEDVQDQLVDRVPAMMSGAGAMAGAVEAMLPQLEEMAERVRDALPASEL